MVGVWLGLGLNIGRKLWPIYNFECSSNKVESK